MKKFLALILCICLVFSFSITSFAVTADEQATDLQSGWGSGTNVSYPSGYSTSWFYKVVYLLREIMVDINDIRNDTYDMRPNIVSIASKSELTYNLLNGELKNYISTSTGHLYLIKEEILTFDSYLSDIRSDTSFIQEDVSLLQKVLADEEDLQLKEDTADIEDFFTDTFFNPDSDLSVNVSDLQVIGHYIRDFKNSFNFRENVGTDSPLTVLSEGSDFMQFFTSETGLALDPSFQGSSGGIVTPPDLPQYSAFNILPYALTSTTSESIFSGAGYRNNRKFSGLNFNTDLGSTYFIEPDEFSSDFGVTGYFYCEPGDVFYFYNIDAGDIFVPNIYFGSFDTNILSGSFWEIYKSDSFAFPSLEPDENNVYSYTIPSLPAGTNPPNDIIACRFMFSGSLDSGSFISLNQYPFENAPVPDEPEPEPIVNWLPLATSAPGGTDIYNGKGWKENTRWSSSSNAESTFNGMFLTGWIPVSSGDTVYTFGLDFVVPSYYVQDIYYIQYADGSYSTAGIKNTVGDSNDVCSFEVGTDVVAVRFSCYGISDVAIISINQYPIQSASVSTFSMRYSAPIDDSQVVTSYYADREAKFQSFIRGDYCD